ncbi:MAG TPA: Ig-like domain-containing protein [Phycisphaerae bacterium]|nr:Ig-like domain-containing protein [Phycisphaerae bacterium]HNU44820.1 Ig-like domain-containing protein [Phycisphaerae bacterium]
MSYAQYLTPRPEVLSDDGVEGIIDLRNLGDRRHRKLESKPEAFLSLTYPTADIKRVVNRLNDRFAQRSSTPALFLFEGLKGSGKSHLLVLIYHLLKHSSDGGRWLSRHGLSLSSPTNAVVVAHKYTDHPLMRLWDFIFSEAGLSVRGRYEVYPDDRQVLEAVGDRHLVVILDELEQGIRMISDDALRRQNIAFLQMLSELGNRSPQVTIFAGIYDAGQEPGATLVRVPNVRVQFARSTPADKARVVLHRLFQNFLTFNPTAVAGTIDSLLNTWRRFVPTFDSEGFRSRMRECYPFQPELLTLILERVPQRGGFQNIRGSLGFLAHLVRATHESEDVITAGHATLRDLETAMRLQDLDPGGDLINRAKSNVEELARYPLSERIAAATMLYTLVGEGRTRGANREELIRHVILPGADINDFEQTLLAFRKYASHFHAAQDQFFFDMEENADAKVEFRSLTIDPDGSKSKALLRAIWTTEVFRETESTVVFAGAEDTKAALDTLRKDRLRVVLAPRLLAPDERHDLYHGLSVRNQVLLLEPRARDFNLEQNADLSKWAQRCLAAKELRDQAERAGDNARRDEYDRIGREDRRYITDAIRRAGLQYMRFEAFGASPAGDRVEPENLGNAITKEQVVDALSQQLFPAMVFQEHLAGRLEQVKSRLVRDVDKEYRETLTFPVPTSVQSVTRAIRELCRLGRIGLYHAGGNYSHVNPPLSESEVMDARLGDPVGTAPQLPQPPQPQPPPPPAELARLEVQPGGALTLNPGDTRRLTAVGYDDNGKALPSVNVAWRSSNPSIVSVSADGVLLADREGQAEITALAGEIISNSVGITVSVGPAEQISIPWKPSKGALRQEIAVRLAQAEGAKITSIRFQFFQTDQEVDLSSLPAGLRGGLSGPGTLTLDVTIAKRGKMTKGQVEQLCEQLPDFRSAQYSARLEIVRACPQE